MYVCIRRHPNDGHFCYLELGVGLFIRIMSELRLLGNVPRGGILVRTREAISAFRIIIKNHVNGGCIKMLLKQFAVRMGLVCCSASQLLLGSFE